MSDVTPKAGEWWFSPCGKHRMYCHGQNKIGSVIMEDSRGSCDCYAVFSNKWHHEPSCTGWDWEPETFPQYYKGIYGTFVRRDSAKQTVTVHPDGSEHEWTAYFSHTAGWEQITEEQALALLDKPAEVKADKVNWDDDRGQIVTLLAQVGSLSEGNWGWTAERLRELADKLQSPDKTAPQPPAESPDDWVEITDPEHVLRECEVTDATSL